MQAYMNRKYEDHRKRVKEAKSTIDKVRPPEMPMSMRREIERRRQQTAIEKDNRLLLDRLGIAMSHKNIDNDLKEKPFTSYIELQRKKELKKIMMDNQRILGRIQNTVPSYSHVEWERDAEKRIEYLRNMTEFPDLFVPPGSSSKVTNKRTPSAGNKRHAASSRSPEGNLENVGHGYSHSGPNYHFLEEMNQIQQENQFGDHHYPSEFVPQPPPSLPLQMSDSTKKVSRPILLPNIHQPNGYQQHHAMNDMR